MFVKEQQDEDKSYLITHKIKKGVYMFDFWGFFKNSKLEKWIIWVNRATAVKQIIFLCPDQTNLREIASLKCELMNSTLAGALVCFNYVLHDTCSSYCVHRKF